MFYISTELHTKPTKRLQEVLCRSFAKLEVVYV